MLMKPMGSNDPFYFEALGFSKLNIKRNNLNGTVTKLNDGLLEQHRCTPFIRPGVVMKLVCVASCHFGNGKIQEDCLWGQCRG